MAKGKHSIALFEVIQKSKSSRGGDSLRTPKWWFKGRTGASVERPAHSVAATTLAASLETYDGPASAPSAATMVVEPELSESAPAPRNPAIDLKLDPDRQRITFHVTYTSAIVAAFTVMVVVGLAYVIGQHMRQGPAAALAGPSIEQVRRGPVQNGVLNLNSMAGSGASQQPTAKRTTPAASGAGAETAINPQPTSAAPGAAAPQHPQSAAAAEVSTQRIIRRNYVVVQIYPDEKSANEARDLLTQNGVQCTIEHGLQNYAPSNWFCVVGLTGFDRIRSNPEYDRYIKQILDAGTKFTKDPKFKKFDPQPYSWRG